ncbi:MAG: 4-phosphoerythronate dehydrogenase [Cellvibrionales bacterium]|nr:4-phosphoerythronate dehydrogenase [Cellvibrionales bacterium]
MRCLVDENIPFAAETFGSHAGLTRFSGRELCPQDLCGADALIVRSTTQVDSALLAEHCPAFVGSCTSGLEHLDTDWLEAAGVAWAHAPGCNAQSVVEYVLCVLAALEVDLATLAGVTIGIIGCGQVGGRLRECVRRLGAQVRVYDPFLNRDQIPELGSLEWVCGADILCLHTPLTRSGPFPTAKMFGREQLERLPPNAILLNAGRGGVIDEAQLLAFMRQRPDLRVALDVWADEPLINTELLGRAQIATPHIAGYSLEGKRRGTLQVYRAFCRHFGFAPTELPELPPVAMEPVPDSLPALLRRVYDPLIDTRNLRQQCGGASNADRGRAFDALRRGRVERRELGVAPIISRKI